MHDDPYILEDMIACGPSAKVYRGHDLNSEKTVRLKVLMDNHVSCPVEHSAIEVLAAALMRLRHANVSSVLELNVNGDDVTLVSEFAAGVNLWTFLHQQRPLSARDVRSICEQLLTALVAGEAMGVRHGDVKPSNVIIADHVDTGYRLQLQDWGEAACRRRQPVETLTYRAPELQEGGEVTAASDLFSAGATLATLILGHAPIHSGDVEQLRAGWAVFDPTQLRCRRPDLEPVVHHLLARLLRYDAKARPQSAQEALEFLTGQDIEVSVDNVSPVPAYVCVPPPTLTMTGDGGWWPVEPSAEQAPCKSSSRPAKRRGWFRSLFSTGIKVTAVALMGGIGYAVWMDQHGGAKWPRQLQNLLAEKLQALSTLAR